eukprot:s640_g2.t3
MRRHFPSIPLVAPVQGATVGSWIEAWRAISTEVGLPFDRFQGGTKGPLLPLPSQGTWLEVSCSTTEARAWLVQLLANIGHTEAATLGAHSCKATCLTWAAKYGLSKDTRTRLGNHNDRGSAECYGRDTLAAPLKDLEACILAIRTGSFLPDVSRSGYFPAARESSPSETVPGEARADMDLSDKESCDGYGPASPTQMPGHVDDADAIEHPAPSPSFGESHVGNGCCRIVFQLFELFFDGLGGQRWSVFAAGVCSRVMLAAKRGVLCSCMFDAGVRSRVMLDGCALASLVLLGHCKTWCRYFEQGCLCCGCSGRVALSSEDALQSASSVSKLRDRTRSDRISNPAERRFRLEEQARRLAGMSLRGPLECAFSCYTLVIRMLVADEITYLAPNRFTTRAHEVQQSKPEVIIDSSSAIKVRDSAELADTCHLPDALSLSQALTRRSLALDLCEAATFAASERWHAELLRHLQTPPLEYKQVDTMQILRADRAAWTFMAEKSLSLKKRPDGTLPMD